MERKNEFDIMKGILIVVVIGHTSITIPYFNPYWFHMPAFFMITGYLTYKWPTFENREQLKKKSAQLLIPYLSYSILFYILLGDIPIWKYALKVIGGGTLNITTFSYPYWYIDTLLVALIIYGTLKQIKITKIGLLIIVLIIYISIHLINFKNLHFYIPFGLNTALGAIVYIYLGDVFKSYQPKTWHYFFLIISIALLFVCNKQEYSLNMAEMKYEHFILDILVPCSFSFSLYLICNVLDKFKLDILMQYLGKSSLTIYFTHAAVIYMLKPYLHSVILLIFCLCFGALLHYILSQFKVTRLLFLGQLCK